MLTALPSSDLLLVFDALPGASLLLAPDLRIVAASDDYLAATQTQRATLVGRLVFDAFGDDPQAPATQVVFDHLRTSLACVLATGQPHEMAPQHYDVPDPARPGQHVERHWLPRNKPVLDAAGQVQFIVHTVTDITASRLAQQQLRESRADGQAARADAEQQRAELQHIFQEAPVAMALLRGPEFVVEWANPRMGQLWGRPPAQVQGRPHFEALPDLAGQGFEEVFAEVLTTGQPRSYLDLLVHIEQPRQAYQGYFNITYQPVYDGPQRVAGLLVFAVEVTEQVRARQQLEQLNQELEARVRQRTQEALTAVRRQAEERATFYQVFEQTPAALSILRGPEHRFEYVNPAYQALFPDRRMVGQPLAAVLPETVESGFVRLLDAVFQTGEPFFGAEMPLTWQPGEAGAAPRTDYYTFTYQAYREAGQIVGVSIFAYDVTQQALARLEREAQRRQLEQLFMQAPAPIVILDGPELVFQLVNPAYQQIFPGRELLNKPLMVALPELTATPVPGVLREVYRTGVAYVAREMPLRLARCADGPLEELYFTFTYQARRNTHGAVDGVVVFAHEVTDQVQARHRTDESAAELRLLTAHAPVFLFRTDAAGHFTYLNDAYFEWSGLERAQQASLDAIWANVHPEDLVSIRALFVAGLATGRPWESPLHRLRNRAGQYRWCISRTQPYLGPDGTVVSHSGVTLEIHEQVELQRQLARTNADLDNFIYTASHDLKAPISNIEGLLLALEHELPAAGRVGDVPQMLLLMQGAVERFQRTIAHLTDIARLQKEHDPASARVSLAGLVEAVRLDLTPLRRQTQARLEVDVPAGLTLTFSEKNLRSIVYNLLSNAFKYGHPDRVPLVQLRCRQESACTVLEVQDNGLGLDLSSDHQSLFGMFQRLHTHVEGTGIGLYMVKKIIDNAGGRIEVASQLGQGSTFAVYFPR